VGEIQYQDCALVAQGDGASRQRGPSQENRPGPNTGALWATYTSNMKGRRGGKWGRSGMGTVGIYSGEGGSQKVSANIPLDALSISGKRIF